jgi:hypothetical protein
MKTTYKNRYGDIIQFNQVDDNTVEMTGYNAELGLRCGYENDYTEAYEEYLLDIGRSIEEPVLGLDYVSFEDFKEKVHKDENLKDLWKSIKSTKEIYFTDPSGGPWISKGMDLNLYYNDGVDRIITSIFLEPNKIIFKINEGNSNKNN